MPKTICWKYETEKVVKHANLHDKNEYVIRNLKQALNYDLVSKKVHRVIAKLNQKTWLKSYTKMNTEWRKRKWF